MSIFYYNLYKYKCDETNYYSMVSFIEFPALDKRFTIKELQVLTW